MTSFLSIDWDFFPFNGAHSHDVVRVMTASGKSAVAPLADLFEWDSSESADASNPYATLAWQARAFAWALSGLDIETVATIDPERGCVEPVDFVEQVRRRWDLGSQVAISDSHVFAHEALLSLRDAGETIDTVVHFDAHHDLGYRQTSHGAEYNLDCGNWLLHALREDLARTAIVVYPDWRGLREYKDAPWGWVDEMGDRVHVTTWSRWLVESQSAPRAAAHAFLCRSSAWTPPWLDEDFLAMACALGDPRVVQDLLVRPWEPIDHEAFERAREALPELQALTQSVES